MRACGNIHGPSLFLFFDFKVHHAQSEVPDVIFLLRSVQVQKPVLRNQMSDRNQMLRRQYG